MTLKQHIEKYVQEKGLLEKMKERKITVDDIVKYIVSEAQKALDGENGAIDDTTVFNWCVHYIEDAYKEKYKVEEVEAKVTDGKEKEKETKENKEIIKENEEDPRKEEHKPYEQMSLLDYMTEELQKEKDSKEK